MRWVLIATFVIACGDSAATQDGGVVDSGGSSDAPQSSDGGDAGPVTPTISSWLGTNVSADLSRVDITYQLKPFDTQASQKDPNGYPVAGASGTSSTDIGFVLTTGTYKIAYVGTGTLAVSGIGKLGPAWTTVSGEQRNTVDITGTPGAFGNFLTLKITNAPSQTVQSIRILYPGFDYATPPMFLPQFINVLKPFRALRFMDWEATNNSKLTDWVDRPTATHFGASSFGEPYEHIAELVNETGKDAWITIPELASDDFIHQFAKFLRATLDFGRIATARQSQGFTTPFQVIVEDSNETWNQGFSAYATFSAAAKANASRYPGKYSGTYGPSWMSGIGDLMQVGQYHGDRLAKIATIFKTEFTDQASAIHPVLSGWALGAVYSDVALQFIQNNYGDPKGYVSYIAQAPYFAPPDDSQTGNLASLFVALDQSITSMNTVMQDFKTLGAQWGIPIAAYEGGQGLSGNTNLAIKHLAQHDARMYAAYQTYATFWKTNFGESLFMHFSLASDPGIPENIYQYGFWGSIDGVLTDTTTCGKNLPTLTGTENPTTVLGHCAKYQALADHVPN